MPSEPLPEETLEACRKSDAVLLGAGEARNGITCRGWRPEAGLLGPWRPWTLCQFTSCHLNKELRDACTLRPDIIGESMDIMVVRELTGGIYFGERGRRSGKMGEEAFDTESYSVGEVERIARLAFEIARKRSKKVTSVDKAKVLESSRLWREGVLRVANDFPDVALPCMLTMCHAWCETPSNLT